MTSQHLSKTVLTGEWPDLNVFCFLDDLSTGPVSKWDKARGFAEQRHTHWAALWGEELDMEVEFTGLWATPFPVFRLEELSNVSEADLPEIPEFEEAVTRAERVSIWFDDSVQSQIWRHFAVMELQRLGVDKRRVFQRRFDVFEIMSLQKRAFRSAISEAVVTKLEHRVDVARSTELWQARVSLPTWIEGIALEPEMEKVFRTICGRFPDAQTGLSNLQARVLCEIGEVWIPMARPVGNAMAAGLEENDHVGDMVLKAELVQMANHPTALVQITGTSPK
ncbi:DUF1835 domain-containing protein [Pelagimonas phthalicica]|nr:DUF1835 domain-containing protein [Pelagimonas phthalicica]